jgi:hypothetical protein
MFTSTDKQKDFSPYFWRKFSQFGKISKQNSINMGKKFPGQEKLFITAYKPILDVLQRDFLNWINA